jgi:hypothetical protein
LNENYVKQKNLIAFYIMQRSLNETIGNS